MDLRLREGAISLILGVGNWVHPHSAAPTTAALKAHPDVTFGVVKKHRLRVNWYMV